MVPTRCSRSQKMWFLTQIMVRRLDVTKLVHALVLQFLIGDFHGTVDGFTVRQSSRRDERHYRSGHNYYHCYARGHADQELGQRLTKNEVQSSSLIGGGYCCVSAVNGLILSACITLHPKTKGRARRPFEMRFYSLQGVAGVDTIITAGVIVDGCPGKPGVSRPITSASTPSPSAPASSTLPAAS